MKVNRTLNCGVLISVLSAAISAPFFIAAAESPISVESRESRITYRVPIEEEPSGSGLEGQYQLQLLQQEVMTLRGLIEQLQHELSRLKAVQDDRYLELDARLQQALKTRVVGAPNQDRGDSRSTTVDANSDLSEKEVYETIQLLIRNRQYELSITQLESLIARFPDGEYTPNAYYWLGQVHAAKTNPDFEQARQALAQVISYFPEHSKVPDAAYALGKVYHMLGDCARATELLQQVMDQYQGKSAAKLAENYLRESVNCES